MQAVERGIPAALTLENCVPSSQTSASQSSPVFGEEIANEEAASAALVTILFALAVALAIVVATIVYAIRGRRKRSISKLYAFGESTSDSFIFEEPLQEMRTSLVNNIYI